MGEEEQRDLILKQLADAMNRMAESVKDLTKVVDDTREILEHIVDVSTK